MARIGFSFSLLFIFFHCNSQDVFIRVIEKTEDSIEFRVNVPPDIYKLSTHISPLLQSTYKSECDLMARVKDLLLELSLTPGSPREWRYYKDSINQIQADESKYCN